MICNNHSMKLFKDRRKKFVVSVLLVILKKTVKTFEEIIHKYENCDRQIVRVSF